MKPGVRVCMILQDQMMMEEPKYLREAKRSETHEEVLLKMMKKIGIIVILLFMGMRLKAK